MAETINVRVQQMYDSLADWNAVASKKPLAGEVCIFNITSENEIAGATNLNIPAAIISNGVYPVQLSKTGDGTHTLAELPWDTALAGDVYAWAKAATPPIPTISTAGQGDSWIDVDSSGSEGHVSYNITHKTVGAAYTSGNTVTTVGPNTDRSADKATTIKIPQITVDDAGHVTAGADESITFTIPKTQIAHTHKVTAAGSVSQPTFTPIEHTHTATFEGSSTGESVKYAPAGTVSKPTFTGSAVDSGAPVGTTSVATGTHTHTIVAEGTVTIDVGDGTTNYTPSGKVTINSYQPEGTVSTPTITVTPNTTTIQPVSNVGSLPTWYGTYDSDTQDLEISFSAGALPTLGTAKTLVTSIKSATSTQPTFTGTSKAPTGSFTGTGVELVADFEGASVDTASITGTANVASATHKHSVTAAGTVSQPTFTGTEATITTPTPKGTVTIVEAEANGTVSKPTFTGTEVSTSGTTY